MSSEIPEISSHEVMAICLVFSLLSYLEYRTFRFKQAEKAYFWPSPPRIPLLGSIPFIHSTPFSKQCLIWRQRYGPIISLKLGTGNDSLVVSGHQLAKELFIDNNSTFSGRATPFFYTPQLRLLDYFPPAMSTTPHVLVQRKLLMKAVKSSIGEGLNNCIDRSSREILQKLKDQTLHLNEKPCEIRSLLLQSAAVCAINLGFGFCISIEEFNNTPEAFDILHATEGIFEMLKFFEEPSIAFPFLVKLLWWRSQRLSLKASDAAEKLLNSHQKLYQMAKHKLTTQGEDALESSVAKTLLTSCDGEMTEFQKACLAGTTAAAAMTTAPNTMNSALGCLAIYLDFQKELREEISQIVVPGQLPSSEPNSLKKLSKLQAFIQEVMRMFPAFPLLSRVAEKDFIMSDGRKILKDQVLYINFYGINRDPEIYDSPESFKPSRFLKSEEKSTYWPKYGHASFGAGRRSCPGSEFAMNMMLITLSRLIYAFDIKFSNPFILRKIELLEPLQIGVEQHTQFPNLIFTPLQNSNQIEI